MSASTRILSFEALSARNAPSDLVGTTPASTDWLAEPDLNWLPAYVSYQDGDPQSSAASENLKPVIKDFEVVINPGWVGVFRGQVIDEAPGGLTVRFSGAPQCIRDASAVTDENGFFSFEGQLIVGNGGNNDSGYVYADVTDAQGLDADYATFFVYVD